MIESTTLLDPVRDWDHVKGAADAAFTLVEYGDYECPACGQLFQTLQQAWNPRWRLVYRHYPMSGVHKRAQQAAEAAEAAGAQGRFWEMHELLFLNQTNLQRDDLVRYATQLDLDVERFRQELKQQTYADRVRRNFIAGVQNGVNGTPGLFLNGVRQQGVFDEAFVRSLLTA